MRDDGCSVLEPIGAGSSPVIVGGVVGWEPCAARLGGIKLADVLREVSAGGGLPHSILASQRYHVAMRT
jgi:hypothetical protein